ncbi:hypothetical protein [Tunturiibacter gelidiferens]|uniref:Uncharacterized protein n=1 Tax=Tunturiibacter gelidiferens TaxID=3069689 RepID=A0AAU7YZ13_9BACT
MSTERAGKVANKYKRAFSWRLQQGAALNPAAHGSARLANGDYPDILEDYLITSRKRQHNPTAMAQLQMHILHDAAVQEKSIKHYKAQTPVTEREREFIDSQIFMHRMTANTLRIIGDGIAWRAFGYDRSVPRVLSQNPVNQVILSEGLIAEMDYWSSEFFTRGSFPILNCITNCLALGDVTVVREDGSVEVVEVKAGKTKDSRKIKQKQRLGAAIEVLNGYGKLDEKFVSVKTLPLTPQNYLSKLEELLQQAEQQGTSGALISPYCYVECFDISKIEDMTAALSHLKATRIEKTSNWKEELTSEIDSMQVATFSPNVAPFSIFPFSERTCVELAIGLKSYTCYVNLELVFVGFQKEGWLIEKQMNDALQDSDNYAALMVKKNGFYCHFPPSDIAKLHMELLTPESLIAQCEYLRGLGREHEGEYGYLLLEGEASQWR